MLTLSACRARFMNVARPYQLGVKRTFVCSANKSKSRQVAFYANQVSLNTGDGADRLTLNNVRTPRADVQMGAGNDRVIMRQLDIDTLFAFGSSGDDFFDVRSSSVRQANFYGEGGYDTFQPSLLEPNTFGELNLFTFERRLQV